MQSNVSDFGLTNTRRQSNHTLSRTGPGQTRLKLYTLGPKTIPYPAARPRIAHIGEYPPPPGSVRTVKAGFHMIADRRSQ